MANCKFCGREIHWLRESGKYTPLETDGGTHKCEERLQAKSSLKKIERSELGSDLIAQYEEAINKSKKK